ncbi:MAG: nickel pincer cofactor biosynthesis protein LarC [Thermoplasmata archaeon]|nr:MAG: nickel pincer cofactor biosynthesis protein LarC [Thermoplasmata archaeon]
MIAYVDIISGISGDMFLAALIDVGFSLNKLKKELSKLEIEFEIEAKKEKDVIEGTSLYIHSEDKKERGLKEILKIIDESSIDEEVKQKAKEIFRKLAKIEAKIHGIGVDKVHFHELGAVDTIIDIVGSLIAMKGLGIKKLYSSPVLLGKGKVKCRHGMLPVPAPATLELLKGKPVIFSSIPAELTTPTGAALLSMAEFSHPEMEVARIGYGMGKKKLDFPNVLRIVIGREIDKSGIYVIETNIDDMNPEIFPYVIDKLLEAGVLDAFVMPVVMKKGRTGFLLKVLATHEKMEEVKKILFEETTTFGMRFWKVSRDKLERKVVTVKTKYGEVRVKIGYYNGKVANISPEYEDCRRIAMGKGVAIKEVYEEARKKASSLI